MCMHVLVVARKAEYVVIAFTHSLSFWMVRFVLKRGHGHAPLLLLHALVVGIGEMSLLGVMYCGEDWDVHIARFISLRVVCP